MPETPSPLDAPVALELTVDGRMLAEIQHRPADRLGETDTAALVATLRFAADALAEHHLGRPAERELDEPARSFTVQGDIPSNVE